VPFSYAATIFESEVRRTASHPFNNIGNLTYISEQLNGLGALSDYFADLAGERTDDHANVIAHFLGSTDDDSALKQYEKIRRLVEDKGGDSPPESKDLEKAFSRMTAVRRQLIRSGFEKWLRELSNKALRGLDVGSLGDLERLATTERLRIEPRVPLFPIERD